MADETPEVAEAPDKMRARNSYSADYHRRAFDIWFETRNFTEVSRQLDVSYPAVCRWAWKDFNCVWNCPYHNWHYLAAEREKIAREQIDSLESGNADPISMGLISLDTAQRMQGEAFPISSRERKQAALLGISKSEAERLAQMELLYNKIYFDLTGIPLAYQTMKDPEGKTIPLNQLYTQGLRADSVREATSALAFCLLEIEKIKKRSGLINSDGILVEPGHQERSNESELTEDRKLTLADLRKIKEKFSHTSPAEIQQLKRDIANG